LIKNIYGYKNSHCPIILAGHAKIPQAYIIKGLLTRQACLVLVTDKYLYDVQTGGCLPFTRSANGVKLSLLLWCRPSGLNGVGEEVKRHELQCETKCSVLGGRGVE
jgi:hypothetical protein